MIDVVLGPLSLYASGTLNSNVGSEDFLSSPNVLGTFKLVVDLNAMAAGDYVELRIYQMVLTGGTQRVIEMMPFPGVQSVNDVIAASGLVGNNLTDTNAVRFSLKQTLGTSRAYPWKVLKA